MSAPASDTLPVAMRPRRPLRRRTVIISAVGIVGVGLLVAVFAMAKPTNQQLIKSPLLGKPAPPIVGRSILNRGYYRLSGFAGRWVLVNFFASWCVPCREEEPQLEAFQTEHARRGDATIFAVEYDQADLGAAPGFLTRYHATFPAVDDPAADVNYGVTGIPESYLVDPAGTVLAKYFGAITAAGLNAEIAKLEATSQR